MVSRDETQRPTDELPCIWSLAGVLSYRLCDCGYDCEGCELYRVLSSGRLDRGSIDPGPGRGGCSDPADAREASSLGAYLAHVLSGCRVYLDRPYLPPHFWLQRETGHASGETVRAGLDGSLLSLLRPIRRIVATGRGIRLERGQPCGWIARAHMAITLRMPIAGEVVESNPRTRSGPGGVSIGDDNWLLRIDPSEDLDTVPGLVRGEQTLIWYADRLRVVKEYLRDAIGPGGAGLGELMADGGMAQSCLEDVLGAAAFSAMVGRIARS